MLEDLALIGVLAPTDRPGMWEKFTSYRERDQRPTVRVEVQAPLAWWDTTVGDGGIRGEVYDAIFGDLSIPAVDLAGPRPAPAPALKDTLTGGLSARVRGLSPKASKAPSSVGAGPAAPGDIWAIRIKPGQWVTAYLHELRETNRPYAYAEFLAGVFPEMPLAADISAEAQPRRTGRTGTWVHSLEKTPLDAPDRAGPTGPRLGGAPARRRELGRRARAQAPRRLAFRPVRGGGIAADNSLHPVAALEYFHG